MGMTLNEIMPRLNAGAKSGDVQAEECMQVIAAAIKSSRMDMVNWDYVRDVASRF